MSKNQGLEYPLGQHDKCNFSLCKRLWKVLINQVQKNQGMVQLQDKYLKQGMKILAPHILKIFNEFIQHGFPRDQVTILEIPLFKSGYVKDFSNYQTINDQSFAKLFDRMLEHKISKWIEQKKRAKGASEIQTKSLNNRSHDHLRGISLKMFGMKL